MEEIIQNHHSTFFDALALRCNSLESSLCIGLDPDPRRLPKHLGAGPKAVFRFCAEIIEATADNACAFKPNIAFFESIGIEGWNVLQQVLEMIPKEVPVIVDAKRGDISTTGQHYARSVFERLKANAITVNPYMGYDSIEPFLEYRQRGVYILVLTSNKGYKDFQLHKDLYLKVARKIKDWNKYGNIGMVVGATKPQFLSSILAVAPNIPMLIPGLGAQGGDLDALMSVTAGLPLHHVLLNVSRSIIFASTDKDFGRQARRASRFYADRIRNSRKKQLSAESTNVKAS
jgi:orotidine-5'-phosphate decarboxylase